MHDLTYSFRDPWRAPRLGASGKKMWVAFKGIVLGYLIYLVFGYAANMAAGQSLASTWEFFHLFPFSPAAQGGTIAWAIWVFGVVAGCLTVLVASVGIAKITYRELKGDDFYGGSDAWRYALEHGRSTIGTPVALAVVLLAVLLALLLLGWVGRIPFVGPIIVGISAFPAFLVAIFGVFVILALLCSFLYTPAVVGTTGEDALEGSVQAMSLLWAVPWRTAGHTSVVLVATAISASVLAFLTLLALALIALIVGPALGEGFGAFASAAISYLPLDLPIFTTTTDLLWPDILNGLLPPALIAGGPVAGGVAGIGAFLAGIGLLSVVATVESYVVSSVVSGTTAAYVVLRKLKDGEDLLDWADEVDELEEQLALDSEAQHTETSADSTEG